MTELDALSVQFEESRAHLHAVAFRILGSHAEADDAVQDAWLRLARSHPGGIDNLGGWLTTVTARICLDRLRTRAARREELEEEVPAVAALDDPEHEALVADSVGAALTVVLETLTPSERVAFVLHDVFGVPFDDIGAVLGRSPSAAKQLASRARRRLRGAPSEPFVDVAPQRAVVDAFLAASRAGDLAGLVAVLDPAVVLHADPAAVRMGATGEVRSAEAVAGVFSGRAIEAQPALADGLVAVAWAPKGHLRVLWELEISGGRIVRIDMLADGSTLDEIDLVLD